jgi:hypothetical protein
VRLWDPSDARVANVAKAFVNNNTEETTDNVKIGPTGLEVGLTVNLMRPPITDLLSSVHVMVAEVLQGCVKQLLWGRRDRDKEVVYDRTVCRDFGSH